MPSVTDENIATAVLRLAQAFEMDVMLALSQFISQAPWLDHARIPHIKRLLGRTGGLASKRNAMLRRHALRKQADRARQGRLFK